MACCMIVGIITTLVNPEPKSGEAAETSFTGTSDYARFFAVFALAVTAFASGFILTGGSVQSVKSSLIESWGVNATAARFFVESCRMVFSISLAALTAWILIKIRLVNIQHVHETYVSPVTDFFLRYGRLALSYYCWLAPIAFQTSCLASLQTFFIWTWDLPSHRLHTTQNSGA